jgi:hypothetical protein
VDVHLGGAVGVILPQGPGHPGQGRQEAAIDGGEVPQGLGLPARHDGHGAPGQLTQHGAEQFGVEDTARFAERPEGDAGGAEALLDLGETGGLLEAAQAGEGRGEEVEQQQGGELIEVEGAVAGAVALGGLAVEALQEGAEEAEVLEALKVLGPDGVAFPGSHGAAPWGGVASLGSRRGVPRDEIATRSFTGYPT